jgi:hypothetical protein
MRRMLDRFSTIGYLDSMPRRNPMHAAIEDAVVSAIADESPQE